MFTLRLALVDGPISTMRHAVRDAVEDDIGGQSICRRTRGTALSDWSRVWPLDEVLDVVVDRIAWVEFIGSVLLEVDALGVLLWCWWCVVVGM